RPGDANECAEAWRAAVKDEQRPTALVLTRQNLPTLDRNKYAPASGTAQGAYVLADAPGGQPELILMASGSELSLAVEAYEQLSQQGAKVRVVSVPSMELFEDQESSYREQVLPKSVTRRIAIEAGIRQGWDKYLGPEGVFVGMDDFGASGPYTDVYEARGITTAAVVKAAKQLLDS